MKKEDEPADRSDMPPAATTKETPNVNYEDTIPLEDLRQLKTKLDSFSDINISHNQIMDHLNPVVSATTYQPNIPIQRM